MLSPSNAARMLRSSTFSGQQLALHSRDAVRCARCTQPTQAAQKLQGKVVSTRMDKTAVIEVDRFKPHPLYSKRMRVTKKYFAHDPEGVCTVGDLIVINPCAPISKNKYFKVGTILKKSSL